MRRVGRGILASPSFFFRCFSSTRRAACYEENSVLQHSSRRITIVSGGQTGADRAALDWALARGIECGGWCPKGRKAEDGPIDPKYPLKETPSAAYIQRTEWNVRDSDATVVFSVNPFLTGGSKSTVEFARKHGNIAGERACLSLSIPRR
jgi:Circularly permutated YpsA SLOG family